MLEEVIIDLLLRSVFLIFLLIHILACLYMKLVLRLEIQYNLYFIPYLNFIISIKEKSSRNTLTKYGQIYELSYCHKKIFFYSITQQQSRKIYCSVLTSTRIIITLPLNFTSNPVQMVKEHGRLRPRWA